MNTQPYCVGATEWSLVRKATLQHQLREHKYSINASMKPRIPSPSVLRPGSLSASIAILTRARQYHRIDGVDIVACNIREFVIRWCQGVVDLEYLIECDEATSDTNSKTPNPKKRSYQRCLVVHWLGRNHSPVEANPALLQRSRLLSQHGAGSIAVCSG